jgi:hypothetical protein
MFLVFSRSINLSCLFFPRCDLFVHLIGKKYSTCAFQIVVIGKELWGYVDGTEERAHVTCQIEGKKVHNL